LLCLEEARLGLKNNLGVVFDRLDVLVSWVVLLIIGGDVLLVLSPGILWDSPGAVRFNGDVVLTSDNSEETVFSEVGSP
jgi:hypothetical protein